MKLICTIIVAIYLTGNLLAQNVPSLVNYQGRLSNADGTPLATADYMLTFNVYDTTNLGPTPIWGPQLFDGNAGQGHGAKIPVVQGYFNVMLGPVDTTGRLLSDAFGGSNRFVEITVSNRPPIAPRQQILAAPFAFQAANAANSTKLAGFDWSAVFGTNDPANGKIQGTKLANGTITLTNLATRQTGTNVGVGGVAMSLPITSQEIHNSLPAVSISNLVVTLQTSGRPIFVGLICDTNTVLRSFLQQTGSTIAEIQLHQDAQIIARFAVGSGDGPDYLPPSSVSTLTFLTAGTWTFYVSAYVDTGYLYFNNVRLIAYEL